MQESLPLQRRHLIQNRMRGNDSCIKSGLVCFIRVSRLSNAAISFKIVCAAMIPASKVVSIGVRCSFFNICFVFIFSSKSLTKRCSNTAWEPILLRLSLMQISYTPLSGVQSSSSCLGPCLVSCATFLSTTILNGEMRCWRGGPRGPVIVTSMMSRYSLGRMRVEISLGGLLYILRNLSDSWSVMEDISCITQDSILGSISWGRLENTMCTSSLSGISRVRHWCGVKLDGCNAKEIVGMG